MGLFAAITGVSLRAHSQPRPLASQPSWAGYFHLILPQLLMKSLTVLLNNIEETCQGSISQFEVAINPYFNQKHEINHSVLPLTFM